MDAEDFRVSPFFPMSGKNQKFLWTGKQFYWLKKAVVFPYNHTQAEVTALFFTIFIMYSIVLLCYLLGSNYFHILAYIFVFLWFQVI